MAAQQLNDREMLIKISTILEGVQGDIAEMKSQFEAYATKDYVDARIASAQSGCAQARALSAIKTPDTVGGAIAKFASSRAGIALMVVTIVLALLGVLNMLGQNQITQEDIRSLIRAELAMINNSSITNTTTTSGGN